MKLPTRNDYGDYGSRIPGSEFYRAYCFTCGTPMRVTSANRRQIPVFCERCDGHRPKTPGHSGPIDDVTGYQANAIRDMEG